MLVSLPKLAVAALSLVALGAHAAGTATAPLPKVFSDAVVTVQSRVCGELMTGLALGGVQALTMQYPRGAVPTPQRKAVYETGAQAVVLLTMSGSLNLEARLKAGEITGAIEKLAPAEQVPVAHYCQRRVAAWIHAGEVKTDLINQAYRQAQKLLDDAFNENGESYGE